MTPAPSGDESTPTHITTNTGRILRVDAPSETTVSSEANREAAATFGADPARREDVLFRVRRAEDQEVNSWWMIGAFLVVSTLVILLLGWVPGDA